MASTDTREEIINQQTDPLSGNAVKCKQSHVGQQRGPRISENEWQRFTKKDRAGEFHPPTCDKEIAAAGDGAVRIVDSDRAGRSSRRYSDYQLRLRCRSDGCHRAVESHGI